MKHKESTILFSVLIAAIVNVWNIAVAQDATFAATVSSTKVGEGEQFDLSLTVSGNDVNGASNLRPPDFGNFVVISGPNQSSNFQWINGQTSATISYSYVLYARQTGKYTIGAASIDYKSRTLKTQPITMEIVQGKPQQQAQAAGQPDAASMADNLFIKAVADKQRVRQGEQLIVTYKLYTRVSVSGYDLAKAPTFEGFWSEDFELPKQPSLTNETVNSKQYRVATIKRTALFATQWGVLKIAPIEVRCAVQVQSRRRSNDPFDSFFNDPFFQQMQTVNYDFKSNPLSITVDPLPSGAPASFSGAIGKYTFSATADKKEVKAGEPITLRLTVAGSGNVKLLAIPKPSLPADIEAYDPKISEEITRDAGVIRGKKTAEYLLIPRNEGKRVIESVPFTYFDLDKKQFVTTTSPRFEFNILPGKEFALGNVNIASKEDIKMLGEDIRFLKLSPGSVRPTDESPFSSPWLPVGLFVPPVMFIGAFIYRKRMEKIYGDMPRLLFETASREASKRLKSAKTLLAKGNTESYHAEITHALRGYLEHKLRIPKATLSLEAALPQLRERGVPEEALQKLKACIDRAEFARFAPSADSRAARKDLLDAAADAINLVERTMNGKR